MNMPSWRWRWLGVTALVIAVLMLVAVIPIDSDDNVEMSLGAFIAAAQAGQVTSATIDDQTVEFKLANDTVTYETELERGDTLREVLFDAGLTANDLEAMNLRVRDDGTGREIITLLIQFLPVVFIVAILFFFLRQASQGNRRWPFSMLVTNFDPVCRITVNPGSAAGSSTFMNNTYYFCSPQHKAEFDADPVKYLIQK